MDGDQVEHETEYRLTPEDEYEKAAEAHELLGYSEPSLEKCHRPFTPRMPCGAFAT
jgi:hypothetical protein